MRAMSDNKNTILIHGTYASPYYDPVKAHEYYEEHKKLKGNQRKASTATLNEQGKKAALYVKKQIDDEHKAASDKLANETKAKYESAQNATKDTIKSNTAKLKSSIESLQVRLKMMNPAQRKIAEKQVKREIENLRKANNEAREKLQEEYKNTAKNLSEEHSTAAKKLSEDYNNKYIDEVERMNKDSSMVKPKKSGKSGSGKGSYVFAYKRNSVKPKT